MLQISISQCPSPCDPKWQIGISPIHAQKATLIAWSQEQGSNEGGVPKKIAKTLAEALTAVASVAFFVQLDEQSRTLFANEPLHVIKPDSLLPRLSALVRGLPRDAALVATRAPKLAMQLFEGGAFSWQLQSQLALLLEPGTSPPVLSVADVDALLGATWADKILGLAEKGVLGGFRPGVDGDIAAVFSAVPEFKTDFVESLRSSCRINDVELNERVQ